jgi:flagella basal body P-ring formation protein FlgA
MLLSLFATIGALLAPALVAGTTASAHEAVRDAIVKAVVERLRSAATVDVDIIDAPVIDEGDLSAVPAPGARLGGTIRFLVSAGKGRPQRVVANVSVVAGHAVARQAIARDAQIAADDVEWKEGRIDGALLQPLPALDEVVSARPKRTIAAGEILSHAVLARQPLVRAGDEVSITIRSGLIEVRGVGRAASSGFIGDVIRVTRPGSRDPQRARIVAPAAVEIMQ